MADEFKELIVKMDGTEVGRLRKDSGTIYFAYSRQWLSNGFSISPRSLPLEDRVFSPRKDYFGGLFGVFSDSLPDGWGTFIAVRALRKRGISYLDLDPLDRLAIIGDDGLGALRYEPAVRYDSDLPLEDLDAACRECNRLMDGEDTERLDEIFSMAGSTGGARPKANCIIDGEEWIVKFRERRDPEDVGRMEYEYNMAAKECGIDVPDVRLLPSEEYGGFFASKRFDRIGGRRAHMITLGGLLEAPKEMPLLDYTAFLRATGYVTNSPPEVFKAYRLACFNILAGNCDDHSKNFAYLYSPERRGYILAPAYDLTRTPWMKEHEMTCMGSGTPGEDELIALATEFRISENKARATIDTVRDVIRRRLSEWV